MEQYSHVRALFSGMLPTIEKKLGGSMRFRERLGSHIALVRFSSDTSDIEVEYDITTDYTIFRGHLAQVLNDAKNGKSRKQQLTIDE